ncbi:MULTISPECIES: signal peptidase I [Mammaliicoccus]|uniref:Signal peptidase I n=1 Tax=Mammaliicoccus fleurettii TaxID=150056 RepID=A0ABS5MK64_9STAP|nr:MULTISPECIES: signal peptidase I [Mammaliicoccus]HCN61561.1 signal peptidase I [Staphylococcus sp.]MBL0847798.1 signal peptidase I [Mammaliicoccus fleurettii]MBO3063149.1 signal peptidase I [Mammaliicoccus fleurettii]MBS3671582.1 signal peptidase I [Mammaliicoccus fleurettii]MBS3696267.1 signal peptidase I [Mammaliicoccus fleurettii]
MKKEIFEWVVAIAVAVVCVLLIQKFLFVTYTVSGDSMHPTLKNGEKVIVNKIGYKVGNIDNGDVIVFHANENDDYVKRVIGKPGDTVKYDNDQLYVNDKKVPEEYLKANKANKSRDLLTENFEVKDLVNSNGVNKIPKGEYLVLGDNREVSKDGRSFGLINEDVIVGEVALRFWPINQFHYDFDPSTN